MKAHDLIRLEGLEFYGYHGALPEENVLGQRFIVDLELYTDFRQAAAADDLAQALNYAEVYQIVKTCVAAGPYNLIETLAERIAQRVLSETICHAVKVVVHKPNAPLGGIFRDVAVEIYRSKE